MHVSCFDRFLASLASANFNNRSFPLSDEAKLNIYDRQFAAQVAEVFDLMRAPRTTLEQWLLGPIAENVMKRRDSLAGVAL